MSNTKRLARRLDTAIVDVGISRKALAERAGLSPSLVSQMARGERTITTDSAAKMAPHLGVAPDYLTDIASTFEIKAVEPTSLSRAILDIMRLRDPRLLQERIPEPAVGSYVASPNALPDLSAVQDAVCHLIVGAVGSSTPVLAYLEGKQDAKADIATDKSVALLRAIDYLFAKGAAKQVHGVNQAPNDQVKYAPSYRLRVILGLGNTPEQNMRLARWVLSLMLRYALREQQHLLEVSVVRNISPRFPRDLWCSENGFVDSFPLLRDEYIEQGVYVQGPCKPYQDYWKVLYKSTSTERIEVFTPEYSHLVWEKLTDTGHAGEIRLVQPFFTRASRPKGDFSQPVEKLRHKAPLSGWMKRELAARKIDPSKIEPAKLDQGKLPTELQELAKLAEDLERLGNEFVDHVERSPFYQIFDRNVAEVWAKTGQRQDMERGLADDSPEERLARIDQLLDYLGRFPNFHLICVEDLGELTELTRRTASDHGKVISWMTNANARLVIVGSTLALAGDHPYKTKEAAGDGTITAFIPVKDAADNFNAVFDEFVKSRPLADWRRDAVSFLKNIRRLVQLDY